MTSSFKEYLQEADQITEYGCLMCMVQHAGFMEKFKTWITNNIDPSELAEYGIETEPHITVVYGFDSIIDATDIQMYIHSLKLRPLEAKIVEINKFKQDEYDVLKFEVRSPDLQDLHNKLRNHFGELITWNYDGYNAHMTIAYVKPNTHNQFEGMMPLEFLGQSFIFNSLTFSTAGEKKHSVINL